MRPTSIFRPAAALLFAGICLAGCLAPVPVDVMAAGGEVYFALKNPEQIRAVWVIRNTPTGQEKGMKPAWALRHALTSDVKKRRYPKVSRFRYGQKFPEFSLVTGPEELLRNVEYVVNIDMGGKFAREVFLLTEDGQVRIKGKGSPH